MSGLIASAGRSRLVTALVAIALVASACSGSASPSPTMAPTARPTPTPLDVGRAFLAIVGQPDFSAEMAIDGTMEMGVMATLSGTITTTGDDIWTVLRIEVAGTSTEIETITADSRSYSRTAPGPWLEDPDSSPTDPSPPTDASPPTEDESLAAWLRTLLTIEDLGVVTKGGQKLHHLSGGDEPLPPAALGLDPATFTDAVVTMDFYAEDDGTPAIFTVKGTWLQLIGGQDINVDFVMDMTLSKIGSKITIEAPEDVWTSYESPLGYSMAHPMAFSVENRDGYDAYVGDGVDYVYVQSWPEAAGLNAEGFRDAIVDLVKDEWGDPIEAPGPAVLGGEAGYIATFRYTYEDGSEEIAFDAMAMHANIGWDVTLFSLPGQEDRDFDLLQQFLATFTYAE